MVRKYIRRREINGPLPIWLGPIFSLTMIFGVTLFLFTIISDNDFSRVFHVSKVSMLSLYGYAGWAYCWIAVGMATVYALVPRGALQADRSRPASDYAFIHFLGHTSLILALSAYFVYFVNAGLSFDMLLDGFSGESGASYRLRHKLQNIPGITSLMNVAPWWYVYIAYKRVIIGRKLNRFEVIVSLLLLSMVITHAFAAFERRAMISLFIPTGVFVLFYKRNWSLRVRSLISLLPVLGITFITTLFLVGEYFKSWVNHYAANSGMSFFEFGLTRLAGYYVTSVNNAGLAIWDNISTAGRLSLRGIYKIPGLGDFLGGTGEVSKFTSFLERSANPEFNNPGGAVATIVDFGLWGSAVFLFLHGFIFTWLYVGARQRRIIMILLYSLAYFAILESTRIWFFMSPFSVLNLLYVPIIYIVFRRRLQKKRQGQPLVGGN